MEIPLTQGKIARIDPEDWPLVAEYRWYAAKSTDGRRWYAQATPPNGGRNSAKVKMHNLILGIKNVDHISSDGLDNRRQNLRPCTNASNQQNTEARGGTSSFKGVSWHARKRMWQVRFNWQGASHFIGYFADEAQAAIAYNTAILPLAGEFARLNVVPGPRLHHAPDPSVTAARKWSPSVEIPS
ncbi:endonuclease [Gemmata sp. JC717]|uniref:endonuclease n=1 Tax=Gemmata algarum TaxID=2975278 RepID=UPI0021BB8FFA|nr:endonuclease [Gemmata algarum]MDY3551360.1 endonuclease [Gemmata algarum]